MPVIHNGWCELPNQLLVLFPDPSADHFQYQCVTMNVIHIGVVLNLDSDYSTMQQLRLLSC